MVRSEDTLFINSKTEINRRKIIDVSRTHSKKKKIFKKMLSTIKLIVLDNIYKL